MSLSPLRSVASHWRALLPGGLFWRTFALIGVLLLLSMTTWVLTYRALENAPRAEQLAQHVVSIVNVTRAAILNSSAQRRRALLLDLAHNESIRIFPIELDDEIGPLPNNAFFSVLTTNIQQRLGVDTRIAGSVNDEEGLWISFVIDDDAYWVAIARDRVDRVLGVQWIFWAAATLILSLAGAAAIVGLVNQPLARLGRAALQLSRGQSPTPLPESNLREIRVVNESFNRMVEDLQRIEADRVLILAGISHDLRTPLARLALEVEMSPSSQETKDAMAGDIAQMDKIVAQFLDYARPQSSVPAVPVNLSDIVRGQAEQIERLGAQVTIDITADLYVMGNSTELTRVVTNVIDNAAKYGRQPDTEAAQVEVSLKRANGKVVMEVLDGGPGVAPQNLERIKRPFTRANEARGQTSGAGLGLAIVDRVIKRSNGSWRIANRSPHGLAVTLELPIADAKAINGLSLASASTR